MKQSFWRIDQEHTVLEGPSQFLGMKLEDALEMFKQDFGDFSIEIQKQPFDVFNVIVTEKPNA